MRPAIRLAAAVSALILISYVVRGALLFPRVALRVEGEWLLRDDAELGMVAKPGAVSRFLHDDPERVVDVFTDSHGARVAAADLEGRPQVDVLAVGGSFTWGYGLAHDETFLAHLSALTELEVANFAMGSYGSVQSLRMLERHAALAPRYLIYGFIDDHLQRNLSPCIPSVSPYCIAAPYFDPQSDTIHDPRVGAMPLDVARRLHEAVIYRSRLDVVSWLAAALLAAHADWNGFPMSYESGFEDSEAARGDAVRLVIAGMARVASTLGAELLVVHLPDPGDPDPQGPPAALVDATRDAGAVLVQTEFLFRDLRERGQLDIVDGHPGPRVNEAIGRYLASVIALREGRRSEAEPADPAR